MAVKHEKNNNYLLLFIERTLDLFESYIKFNQNQGNDSQSFENLSYLFEFQQLKKTSATFLTKISDTNTQNEYIKQTNQVYYNNIPLEIMTNLTADSDSNRSSSDQQVIPNQYEQSQDSKHKEKYKWKKTYEEAFLSQKTKELRDPLSSTTLVYKKTFICDLCHKDFLTSSRLKIHERVHTDERPYMCMDCDYRCKNSSHLKVHQRIHSSHRPYKCSVCEYSCKTTSNLKKHERIHSGERPFKCMKCSNKFSDPTSLKWHIRTHN